MTGRTFLSRILIGGLALLGAHTAVIGAETTDAFVVGGWDVARGELGSFESGDFFTEARASLAANYPNATLTSFTELSAANLAGVDMVILPSGARNGQPITPLTAAEQSALSAFVEGGGGALLMADSDSFGGPVNVNLPDAASIAANSSLLAPVGMDTTDTNVGFFAAVVTDGTSTVTNGPFGVVNTITTVFPGRISDLGPNAAPLAEVTGFGDVLAEIQADAIGAGSGAVVILSDFNIMLDVGEDGGFSEPTTDNETLFLNIISVLCRNGDGGGDPGGGDDPIEIEIDILPRHHHNFLKLRSYRAKLPVVVFSSEGFDPCDLDPETLDLAGAGVVRHPHKDKFRVHKIGDKNGDGVRDLLVLFDVGGIDPGQVVDNVATLTGETVDGQEVEGSDKLILIRPKRCPRYFDYYWPKHWHQYWKHHYPHHWKKSAKDWDRDWDHDWNGWKSWKNWKGWKK